MTSPAPKTESIEREVKLGADLAFEVPDLSSVVGRTVQPPEQQMRTAYFDTPEFRLWHRGITLRHRTGEEAAAGTWTVKLPAKSEGPTLDRTELSWGGPRETLPAGATRLLRGITRSSSLHQIVELVATRRRLILHDSAGVPLGELDDDTVTVIGGSRDGVRFRQIELEVGSGGDALVDPVLKQLTSAGARPDGEQKLAKAVDLPVRLPEGQGVRIRIGSSVGDVVGTSIVAALGRLLDNDYRMRLDPSDPLVEGVHQARVATRRLRSDLKLFGSVLDPSWVAHVRAELKWLGEALGKVRDDDVLAGLFDGYGDGSSFDAEGRDELCSNLVEQRRTHCRALAGVLAGDRYMTLLDQLDTATRLSPFNANRRVQRASTRAPFADQPARSVLPGLVGKRWRSLRREVRKAGRHPSDRELHGMRIRAKELRYAAETAAPVIGKQALRTAVAAEEAQNVLGEHHDAVSAEVWLRSQAMEGTLTASYSAGRLAAEQSRSQRRLRRQWRSVWQELDRKKCRRWFQQHSTKEALEISGSGND
jgi:CHAD domain-containing protein